MQELRDLGRRLLEKQQAGIIIGYGEGPTGKVRPIFVTEPQDADLLVYDQRCLQNLAVYLLKKEVKQRGKIALVAPLYTLKTLLQLASEHQIQEGEIIVLAIDQDGKLIEFSDFAAIAAYVKPFPDLCESDREKLAAIEKMSMDERWQYWQKEFSRCFKCYACRAACPLCYCTRCTVDINQPQWIPVPSHQMGNLEWHIMRAMHLAGRCINCGECARACPLDIPLNLLTQKITIDIAAHFDQRAGIDPAANYSLSTFKPDDKEDFIR